MFMSGLRIMQHLCKYHWFNIFLPQIKQTKSKFAFGTAFNAPYVTDSSHTAYQQFIYDNFEWGVPENALKWKLMEWTKVHIKYFRIYISRLSKTFEITVSNCKNTFCRCRLYPF